MSDADIAVAEITSFSDIEMLEWAKDVADTLAKHYPQHLWAVSFQAGALVVKNLSISGFYGMVLENPKRHTRREMLRDAVMKGGELLERADMARGKWKGYGAEKLEGSHPRFFKPWNWLKH